ncbi:Rrf2 family transcriptional regulator [Klebsiella aerogenes]
MNVQIVSETGGVIWSYDNLSVSGIAAVEYTRNRVQEKIIAALEVALQQAKGQMQLQDTD